MYCRRFTQTNSRRVLVDHNRPNAAQRTTRGSGFWSRAVPGYTDTRILVFQVTYMLYTGPDGHFQRQDVHPTIKGAARKSSRIPMPTPAGTFIIHVHSLPRIADVIPFLLFRLSLANAEGRGKRSELQSVADLYASDPPWKTSHNLKNKSVECSRSIVRPFSLRDHDYVASGKSALLANDKQPCNARNSGDQIAFLCTYVLQVYQLRKVLQEAQVSTASDENTWGSTREILDLTCAYRVC